MQLRLGRLRQLLALARFVPVLLAVAAAGALSLACDTSPSPTATPSPTASPTGTPARPATTTPGPTAFPPIDGTIPAQGFGGTEPVEIKSNPDPLTGTATLTAVRIGAHPEQGGWDRFVFEFRGGLPPGLVEYSTRPATQCGSGMAVAVGGQARMFVRFTQTQAHTDAGQPTLPQRELRGPGGAIIEAKQTCDFEGVVEWVIGVDEAARFNVRNLSAPDRVVIDIKQ